MNTVNEQVEETVPPGYKRTDVGILPIEWMVCSIEDLFEYQRTSSFSRSDLTLSGDVACIHYGDIHTRFEHAIDFSEDDVPWLQPGITTSATRLRDGDLIIADASEDEVGVGKCVEVRNLNEIYAIGGLHTIVLRPKGNVIWPGFGVHMLESMPVRSQLLRLATGIKVFGISKGALRDLLLPFPPQPEQRAIADALADVDELLGALEALIAKKCAIKKAAMQQLLTGRTRLPGFSREWETKRLGGVAEIKTGSRNNEDKDEDGRYPFFVRSDVVERINSYSYDCEAILIPGEGRIGEIFHYISRRFDVHQRVYAITNFSPSESGKFVYFYMSMNFGNWAMKNTVKATVDSLRLPTFQTFEMYIPPTKEEQNAIADVLSDMDAEIEALERRRDKTQAIKQGMMQQLLTGRVRLVESTPEGAAA